MTTDLDSVDSAVDKAADYKLLPVFNSPHK
jgi:hypothetical protein